MRSTIILTASENGDLRLSIPTADGGSFIIGKINKKSLKTRNKNKNTLLFHYNKNSLLDFILEDYSQDENIEENIL